MEETLGNDAEYGAANEEEEEKRKTSEKDHGRVGVTEQDGGAGILQNLPADYQPVRKLHRLPVQWYLTQHLLCFKVQHL